MNRRGFLKWLTGASAITAAAVAGLIDVEDLLKPRKTYILPPAQGWRAMSDADRTLSWGSWVADERIRVRFTKQYDITTAAFPMRFDVLYGYRVLRPDLVVRLASDDSRLVDIPGIASASMSPNQALIVSGGSGYILNVGT